jgi:hypothetical protein
MPAFRSRDLMFRKALIGFAVGSAIALAVGALVLVVLLGGSMPLVTEEAYEQASARWDAEGPQSYRLELVVEGDQSGRVLLEVEQGRVTSMLRDGVAPRDRRTWDAWSVPGQFDWIQQDMDRSKLAVKEGRTGLQLLAEFDPRWGFPVRYRRFDLDSGHFVGWEVVRFEPGGSS